MNSGGKGDAYAQRGATPTPQVVFNGYVRAGSSPISGQAVVISYPENTRAPVTVTTTSNGAYSTSLDYKPSAANGQVGLSAVISVTYNGQKKTATVATTTAGQAYANDFTFTAPTPTPAPTFILPPVDFLPGTTPTPTPAPTVTKGFACDFKDRSIAVINLDTNKVEKKIPVHVNPDFILFSDDGSRAYVGGFMSSYIEVLDMTRYQSIGGIKILDSAGVSTDTFALSKNGSLLYVANGKTIIVADTATDRMVDAIDVPEGCFAAYRAPDGNLLVGLSSGKVAIYDPDTMRRISTFDAVADHLLFTPGGLRMVIADDKASQVRLFGVPGYTLLSHENYDPGMESMFPGEAAFGMGMSPDGQNVYVAEQNSGFITKYKISGNSIGYDGTIPYMDGAWSVTFSPDGTRLYVAKGDGTVQVLNVATEDEIVSIPCDSTTVNYFTIHKIPAYDGQILPMTALPWLNQQNKAVTKVSQLDVTDNGWLYVCQQNAKVVKVYNISTDTVEATIPVPDNPIDVVVAPDGRHAYVLSSNNRLFEIDTITNTVARELKSQGIHNYLDKLAVSPDNALLYVMDMYDQVFVVDIKTNNIAGTLKSTTVKPQSFALDTSGARAFTSSGDLTAVYDATFFKQMGVVKYPAEYVFGNVLPSKDGSKVYMTDKGNGLVQVIDPKTYKFLYSQAIDVDQPFFLMLSPDGNTMYVWQQYGTMFFTLDLNTGKVKTTTDLADMDTYRFHPCYGAISPNGTKVYLTTEDDSDLVVLDPATMKAKLIPLEKARGMAVRYPYDRTMPVDRGPPVMSMPTLGLELSAGLGQISGGLSGLLTFENGSAKVPRGVNLSNYVTGDTIFMPVISDNGGRIGGLNITIDKKGNASEAPVRSIMLEIGAGGEVIDNGTAASIEAPLIEVPKNLSFTVRILPPSSTGSDLDDRLKAAGKARNGTVLAIVQFDQSGLPDGADGTTADLTIRIARPPEFNPESKYVVVREDDGKAEVLDATVENADGSPVIFHVRTSQWLAKYTLVETKPAPSSGGFCGIFAVLPALAIGLLARTWRGRGGR